VVLSKRERFIAIGVAAVLGLLVADRLFLSPLMERRSTADEKAGDARRKLNDAHRLFDREKVLSRRWNEMGGKSLKTSQSESEGQLINSINDWARRSGMNLASMQPERTEKEKGFLRLTYRATGTGRISEIRDFLVSVERATVPVSVTDMTITPRKEGTDDLQVTMSIATITQLVSETDKPAPKAGVTREN
jgi:Tfp pilus assembly protein PilO